MTSIFLGMVNHRINKVYTRQHKDYLSENAGLHTDIIISHENIKEYSALAQSAEYVFTTWGMPEFTDEEIALYFPNLKGVFYAAGSVQHFARPFLNRGIKVYSAWAANAVPVAEYTVAQIILANKGFFQACAMQSNAQLEEAMTFRRNISGNYNVNVGLLGAGMIGKLVIRMLKAYCLDVLVFDPFLPDETAAELGIAKVTLNELFERCRVVSNHLANNAQTEGIINYELLSKLAPYATFINTGRGAQVREADLIKILTERTDLTAVLDVTFPEPPVENSEFYKLNNVFLTPHIAGSNGNEYIRNAEYIISEFNRVKNNQPAKYEVTIDMLKTMA